MEVFYFISLLILTFIKSEIRTTKKDDKVCTTIYEDMKNCDISLFELTKEKCEKKGAVIIIMKNI